MSNELEALRNKLKSLSKKKVKKEKEPELPAEEELELDEAPEVEPKHIEPELTDDQIRQKVLETLDRVQKEKEVPEEIEGSEPSEEDIERFRQLQEEFQRLERNGVFRTEILYQLVGINVQLDRIANAFEKLIGVKKDDKTGTE